MWIPAFAGMTAGLCRIIRRWLPHSVGAHGRAPLPRITKPGLLTRNPARRQLTSRPYLSVIPARPIYSSFPPYLFVIPAKAGIHTPALRHAGNTPGFWIPACAGMTGRLRYAIWRRLPDSVGAHGRAPLPRITKPGLLTRNPARRQLTSRPSIPTFQPLSIRHSRPSYSSFLRKRESTPRFIIGLFPGAVRWAAGVWIPAFAGMTSDRSGGDEGSD